MALHWPDARVAVRFEREARDDERDYPPDTIVVVMRPDQVDDAGFVREMRRIVATRSIEREYERRTDVARERDERGLEREVTDEERRFVSNFLGDDDELDEDGLPEFLDDLLDETLGVSPWTPWQGTATHLVIGRCDQVIVGG